MEVSIKSRRKNKKHRKLKIFLLIIVLLVAVVAGYFLISGFISSLPKLKYANYTGIASPNAYPDVSFAVISDLHIYDHSLGTDGEAFEADMKSDRKLLLDGIDLLNYAIDDILSSDARFVLISGDLTKDGEKINHELAAGLLSRLTNEGLKVYVVPGNHDVSSPDAVGFSGAETFPVESVSPEEFALIYNDFGYGGAIRRDTDSLSYVAEPAEGLWLLAIDSCRYKENTPETGAITGGKISQDTAYWIAGVLNDAIRENKAVMVMLHHGVVEHWDGQGRLHGDYLIDDYTHFAKFLASYNARLAFTGHYHAQDVVKAELGNSRDGKYIYDVETGSLVTSPCPIRYCVIDDNIFTCETSSIVDKIHPNTDFAQNATDFVKHTVYLEAHETLKSYKVSDKDTEYIANVVGDAFNAHYFGDEDPAQRPDLDTGELSLWGWIVYQTQRYVLDGLWNDPPPADNDVSFPLN